MRRGFFFFGTIAALLGALLMSGRVTAKDLTDAEARRAKARYYYLAASQANAADSLEKAYALFKKAYETDPTYDEAAYIYGTYEMSLLDVEGFDDRQKRWEEAVNLRRRLIDAYPDDYAQVRLYAQQIMADPQRELNGQPVAREAIRVLERLDSLGSPSSYHLLQLSGIYSMLEMPDSVMGVLSRYERREGSSPELLESKIGLLFKSGATDRAVSEIDSYRKTHPRDEYPLVLMAMLKYANEDMDSTFHYLYEAEKLNPNNFEVKTRIGMLALEQSDTALFVTKTLEALDLPDGDFDSKIDLLKDFLEKTQFEEGSEEARKVRHAFTTLHSQFPQDPELYLLEGAVESSMGNMDKSYELIERSIALNPENEVARVALIQHFVIQEKRKEALEALEKAWDDLGVIQNIRSLGVALAIDQNQYDLGLDLLQRAIKDINPEFDLDVPFSLESEAARQLTYQNFVDLSSIYQEAGDLYHKMEDTSAMARSYESALTITPNNPLTLNNYAYYLALDNRLLDKALEMSERSLTLDPGNPTNLDTKGWILFMKGDYEEAEKVLAETVKIFDDAIENNPDHKADIEKDMVEMLIHYGATLWKNGKQDEARQQWQRAVKADPENEEAPRLLKEGWKDPEQ